MVVVEGKEEKYDGLVTVAVESREQKYGVGGAETIIMNWWVSWWQKRGNSANVAMVVVVQGITELQMRMGGWDQRDFISIILSSKPPPTHFYCFPCSATTFSVFTLLSHFYLFYLFIANRHHHHRHHIPIVFLSPPPPLPHFNCFTTSHYDITQTTQKC